MLVFPQLHTGGMAQYPVRRIRSHRTVRNLMEDGTVISFDDAHCRLMQWLLPLQLLTDSEAGKIQQLFEQVRGRCGTFTFLDPLSNLLSWSEDLTRPVWQTDPMLNILPGVQDPFGTERATRLINAGQTAQALSQSLPVPSWFRYSLSVYARSSAGSSVTIGPAGSEDSTQSNLDEQWRRLVWAGTIGGADEEVMFTLSVPPGSTVDVFGLQVEAQAGPSEYIPTSGRGGVYPSARFDQDELRVAVTGPGLYETTIRVTSSERD